MSQIGDFSPADMLTLAQLSNAAYMANASQFVAELGMHYVAQVGNDSCSALIVTWGGYAVVAIQGTRVLENASLPELYDDLDGCIVHLPEGRVHAGFWDPLLDMWEKVESALPYGLPLVTGHSLGGVRAHLAKALWPTAQVVSFGAPKGADDAFWKEHYPDRQPVRLVYEHDFAPAWPYEGPFTQPAKIQWLHNGGVTEVQNRPGLAFSVSDHSIDQSYIPALQRLAA